MHYKQWRNELFNTPPDCEPATWDHTEYFCAVPPGDAFDFIDRALIDSEIHALYSKNQLGNGLRIIYANYCSDLPLLYISEGDEARRVLGITNLSYLYQKFFESYCVEPVTDIGRNMNGGPMGQICHMLWDIFVLCPETATPAMATAVINVMQKALASHNDNCLASAIHGLGHWALDAPEAVTVLQQWLKKPTTDNPVVIEYAKIATSGMIL